MLPPIGQLTDETQIEVVLHLNNLAEESAAERVQWDAHVQQNADIYVDGDTTPPREGQIVIHEIQCAVIAITDVQMKEPPRPKLEPVETGEPATYYWTGPQHVGIMLGLAPQQVAEWLDEMGQLQAPLPLDPEWAEAMLSTAVPKSVAMPGQFRDDWIFGVDDRNVADVYQTVLDVLWRRSNVDKWVLKNLLDTNIQGWAWGLYEFDDKAKKFILRHLPVTQVYIDPTVHSLDDASFAGFDMVLDADEARAIYPELRAYIDEEAHEGNPKQFAGSSSTDWSGRFDRTFKRQIIEFRVFWLRHQTVVMSKDEAVGAGLVVEQEVVDEQVGNAAAAKINIIAGESDGDPGQGLSDVLQPDDGFAATNEEPAEPAGLGPDPDPSAGAGERVQEMPPEIAQGAGPATAPISRLACLLTATGEEVTPASPNWPTRHGIRQLTVLGQRVVDDRECEFWDIPLLHNINIPLPGARPFGIGEPHRLRPLQQALSRTVNSMVDHADFNAHPQKMVPQSVMDATPGLAKNGFSRPDQIYVIPDDLLLRLNGQMQMTVIPPPMSPVLAELPATLKGIIQEQSGHTPTMRGIAPSAQASGKMVELLQSSGASMMGFKGRSTADEVERLAHMGTYDIVHRMTAEDIRKIYSKLPLHVTRAVCEHALQMEWNVMVKVEAGSGATKMAKTQNALAKYGAGVQSRQTTQEESNIDSRLEDRRMDAEMQKMARQAMMAGPAQGEEEGGEEKPAA